MPGIEYAVGRYGVNRSADTKIIQKLLNAALINEPKFVNSGVDKLDEDGRVGPKTIGAIEKFQQKVLGWSGNAVDGTVSPNKTTWKALNGNVQTPQEIKPMVAGYAMFRQGDYSNKLGNSTSATIAGYGCALCTLTMAATSIGASTKHWPEGLQPRDLTPPISNEICRKANAFSGYALFMAEAAGAMGMGYERYGRDADLTLDDLDTLDMHLQCGYPVAAHVDYKSGANGDHWILIYQKNGNSTYDSIDPATGKKLTLTSARNGTVNNTRWAATKEADPNRKAGILFGYVGSGSSSQQKYIVVAFALLSPGSGGVCSA